MQIAHNLSNGDNYVIFDCIFSTEISDIFVFRQTEKSKQVDGALMSASIKATCMSKKLKEIGLLEQFFSENVYYSADELIAVINSIKSEFNNVTVTLEPHSGGSYMVVYGEAKDE